MDVAKGIVELLGNEAALGQIFQVVTNEYMTWNDVLLLYSEILHKYSYKPDIYLADDTKEIDKLFEGGIKCRMILCIIDAFTLQIYPKSHK